MPGLLIYNAASGSAASIPPERLVAEMPAGTRLHAFREDDDATVLTRQAIQDGLPWVAVAGGDGTVEAAASALVHTGVPLGVIACGTYNNLARSLGIPSDPIEAARLVTAGATRAIDVGSLNDKPFFEAVGVGLDAALFPLGEEIKSGQHLRWLDLFALAWKFPAQTFRLHLDRPVCEALTSEGAASRRWRRRSHRERRDLRLRALMITISNGPFYGMNFAVAPQARLDNGEFVITVFKRFSKWELARHFFSIRAGRRAYAPKALTLRARELTLTARRPAPVHADGTPTPDWPLRLKVLPGALQVFGRPAEP